MSNDRNPTREQAAHSTSSLDFSEKSAAQQLLGSLFGFDFFISYAWADARDYAVELAAKLEREIDGRRYSCFLDSQDYAKGDDWKQAGEEALRRTSILVLVGSPKSLESKPVLREVQIYAETKRRIIPVEFVDEKGRSTLDPACYPSPIHEYLPPEVLRIREPHKYRPDMPHQLAGPSDEVVKQLTESFDLITQSDKRARVFGAAALVFAVVAILALFFWQSSEANRKQALHNEQTAIRNSEEANRNLADANWTLAFTERDQFHDSISAAWHFLRAAEASEKAGLQTHAKSALLAAQGVLDCRATFSHGGSPVLGTRVSEYDSRVLTWSQDGTVRVWDAAPGTPLRVWEHSDAVWSTSFNPDGTRVPTPSNDEVTRLWNTSTDASIRIDNADGSSFCADFASDGVRMLTCDAHGAVRLWDPVKGIPLPPWKHPKRFRFAAFGHDLSRWSTVGDDGTLRLWDTTERTSLRTWNHGSNIAGVELSPDEGRVLTWSEDGVAKLWDESQDSPRRSWKHEGEIAGAIFGRQRPHVLTWSNEKWGDRGAAWLWDPILDDPVQVWCHPGSRIYGARFSPDESSVLTWSIDGSVQLWNPAQKACVRKWKHDKEVAGALFSCPGSRVLTWSWDHTARLWDVAQDAPLRIWRHNEPVSGAAFNGNETRVITWSSDGTVRLWDVDHDSPLRSWKHQGAVIGAAFGAAERSVFTWSSDGTAKCWVMDPHAPIHTWKPRMQVEDSRFINNGLQVLTLGFERDLRLWNVARQATDEPLEVVFAKGEQVLAVSFQESQALTGDGHQLWLWNLAQRKTPLGTWKCEGAVSDGWFDPKGTRLLTSHPETSGPTCRKFAVRLWDASRAEPTRVWPHEGKVLDAQFSRDGLRVLTRTEGMSFFDGTGVKTGEIIPKAQLWDATGCSSAPLLTVAPVNGVRFNSDSSCLLTWSADGTVGLWDVAKGTLTMKWKQNESLKDVQFSSDESLLLTWGRRPEVSVAYLWNKTQESPLRVWKQNGSVNGAKFNQDASRVLSWTGEGDKGAAYLWDRSQDIPLRVWKHDDVVGGAAFSQDESRVLTWTRNLRNEIGHVCLWDTSQDSPIRSWKTSKEILGARFSPGEKEVLVWGGPSAAGVAVLWDVSLDETAPMDARLLDLEVRTATTLDDSGHIHVLPFEQWEQKRKKLDQLLANRRR